MKLYCIVLYFLSLSPLYARQGLNLESAATRCTMPSKPGEARERLVSVLWEGREVSAPDPRCQLPVVGDRGGRFDRCSVQGSYKTGFVLRQGPWPTLCC